MAIVLYVISIVYFYVDFFALLHMPICLHTSKAKNTHINDISYSLTINY